MVFVTKGEFNIINRKLFDSLYCDNVLLIVLCALHLLPDLLLITAFWNRFFHHDPLMRTLKCRKGKQFNQPHTASKHQSSPTTQYSLNNQCECSAFPSVDAFKLTFLKSSFFLGNLRILTAELLMSFYVEALSWVYLSCSLKSLLSKQIQN